MKAPTIQEERREAFRALADRYGVLENERYSGFEDAMEYLAPWTDYHVMHDQTVETPREPRDLGPWVTVTTSGGEDGYPYLYPEWHLLDAQRKAVENIADDIYGESPVAIHNLDTGTKLVPRWSSLQWKAG